MREKIPLKCWICNYRCSQKGTLKRHIVFIHDGKEPLNTLTRNVALFMREKYLSNVKFVEKYVLSVYMKTNHVIDKGYHHSHCPIATLYWK